MLYISLRPVEGYPHPGSVKVNNFQKLSFVYIPFCENVQRKGISSDFLPMHEYLITLVKVLFFISQSNTPFLYVVGNLALGSSGSIITPPAGITGVSVQMMAEIKKNIHHKPCKIKYNIQTGPSKVTYPATSGA